MKLLQIYFLVILEIQSSMSFFQSQTTSWKYHNNSHQSHTDEHSEEYGTYATDDRTMRETPQKLTNLFESKFQDTFAYNQPLTAYTVTEYPEKTTTVVVRDFERKQSLVNDSQSRIVPFSFIKVKKTKQPKKPTKFAQIVQKIIFPDWIWKGSGVNRKVGIPVKSNSSLAIGAENGEVLNLMKYPTITFDNHYSRFLKLFTVVEFKNTKCLGPNGRSGICYHSKECLTFGGSGSTQCAGGLGICCIFSIGCGNVSRQNGTHFVDGGMTYNATGIETCSIEIQKLSPHVIQIRLDFEVFSLQQPTAGNCDTDYFVVSKQNTNNVIPILCGDCNGTHIYVETRGTGNVQLSVVTRGAGVRRWRIRITQFDINSVTRPPSHCLQYETGIVGSVNSFNYNSATTPQYLNNLNYAICIQKAPGFCSVTYTNRGLNGTYQYFQIINANENGDLVIPSGQAGIGRRDCPFDYVLVNGNRLCGDRFNDGFSNRFLLVDAPVTDLSNGPFILSVRTNELDVGGGFLLYYRQNPCLPIITSAG